MSKVLKAGIIGCGGIANNKHLPALMQNKNIVVTAFCDIIEQRAVDTAKKFGEPDSKVYIDYKELLKDETLDVVYVCTPNREHSFITVDALEAGKHVMCEKPMAINSAEAKKMVDAAVRTGKKLTIGYQNRFRDDSRFLKRVCDAGELGDIYYAKAYAVRRRGVPTWGVFTNKEEQGGGPLIDIGTHSLDLTLYMMQNYKPKVVFGKTFAKLTKQTETGNDWGDWDTNIDVEDSAFGFIIMENDALIILESSWALNTLNCGEAKTTLCGTAAGADMDAGVRINRVKYGVKTVESPNFGDSGAAFNSGTNSSDAAVVEADTFINAIINDTEVVTKPEQAYVVTRILEAIYESDKSGKPIYFD